MFYLARETLQSREALVESIVSGLRSVRRRHSRSPACSVLVWVITHSPVLPACLTGRDRCAKHTQSKQTHNDLNKTHLSGFVFLLNVFCTNKYFLFLVFFSAWSRALNELSVRTSLEQFSKIIIHIKFMLFI